MKTICLLILLMTTTARAAEMSEVVNGFWSIYTSSSKSWEAILSNLRLMDQCLIKYKASKNIVEKEFLLSRVLNALKSNLTNTPDFLKPSFKNLINNIQTLRFYNKNRKTDKERELLFKIDSKFDYLRIFI